MSVLTAVKGSQPLVTAKITKEDIPMISKNPSFTNYNLDPTIANNALPNTIESISLSNTWTADTQPS